MCARVRACVLCMCTCAYTDVCISTRAFVIAVSTEYITHMREMSWVRGAALLRLTGVWFATRRPLVVDSSFAWGEMMQLYVTGHHQNYVPVTPIFPSLLPLLHVNRRSARRKPPTSHKASQVGESIWFRALGLNGFKK